MTKLEKRIQDLEAKIKELEAKQTVVHHHYHPYPQPYYVLHYYPIGYATSGYTLSNTGNFNVTTAWSSNQLGGACTGTTGA